MDHVAQQLAYFASIDHAERFRWQHEDVFVRRHEHDTIQPLADALRALRERVNRPLTIFESGCGEGVNIMHLRQLGIHPDDATFTGIDMSPEAVAEAQRHGLNVRVGNGLQLSFQNASFDVAFCRDVFHHLENDADRKIFFAEMQRIVRPGGFVAAIEPNPSNPMIMALSATIPEERGLRSISEDRMREMFPGAQVQRVAPSAAWRFWLHFYSPIRRIRWLKALTEVCLTWWEFACRRLAPSRYWSYRVYKWQKIV